MSADIRPDRHALLEQLDALPDQTAVLRGEGDAARFNDCPDRHAT